METNILNDTRRCEYCGNVIQMKEYESSRDFNRRKFCDCKCFSMYRKEKHAISLIGKKFNRLLCTGYKWDGNQILIKCLCDCGNEKYYQLYRFKGRNIPKSCGCYKYNFVHGMSESKLYKHWQQMKNRCLNPNKDSHKYYYDKGIKVCEEWMDFVNFKEWAVANGYIEGLSLDRIDNSGNYCPENCRWVAFSEQSKNRTNISHLVINGVDKSYTESNFSYTEPFIKIDNTGIVSSSIKVFKPALLA